MTTLSDRLLLAGAVSYLAQDWALFWGLLILLLLTGVGTRRGRFRRR